MGIGAPEACAPWFLSTIALCYWQCLINGASNRCHHKGATFDSNHAP